MAESGGLDVILGWMYGGGRFVGVWLLGSVLVLSGVGLRLGVVGLWLLGSVLVLLGVGLWSGVVGVWLLGSVLVLSGVGLRLGVVGLWLLGNGLVLSGVSRMVSLFPMFNAMVSWMLREEVRLWRNGSAW